MTHLAASRARGSEGADLATALRGAAVASPAARTGWDIAGMQQLLRAVAPALELEIVAETGSTNTDLVERARADAPGPARTRLRVAEVQHQGRGRQGRAWQSAPGASLTFSLSLPLAPADWSGLSLAVGVALAEALDPAGPSHPPHIGLKWPNDLWLLDPVPAAAPGRKLGGILIETVACGHERMCVVGVGLNLAPHPVSGVASGFACLQELGPGPSAPPETLGRVAPALLHALRRFEREGFEPFAAAYARRDLLRGRPIGTTLAGLPRGWAEGVDADGALRVRDGQGRLHAVHAGDVSIRLNDDPVPAGEVGR